MAGAAKRFICIASCVGLVGSLWGATAIRSAWTMAALRRAAAVDAPVLRCPPREVFYSGDGLGISDSSGACFGESEYLVGITVVPCIEEAGGPWRGRPEWAALDSMVKVPSEYGACEMVSTGTTLVLVDAGGPGGNSAGLFTVEAAGGLPCGGDGPWGGSTASASTGVSGGFRGFEWARDSRRPWGCI